MKPNGPGAGLSRVMMTTVLLVAAAVLAIIGVARVAAPTARLVGANLARFRQLRRLQHPSELAGSATDVFQGVEHAEARCRRAFREDYVLTGAALATLGLVAVLTGQAMAYGELAVAAYLSGLVCIVLGVAVALIGSVARLLARPVLPPDSKP